MNLTPAFIKDNPVLTEIHVADIHFGNKSTKIEDHYNIMIEQFINPISAIHFDLLSINGDLFDHKVMANSYTVMYTIKFIDLCVQLCRARGATLVLLLGTAEHDADQLRLFYHYLDDPTIDIRIVETAKIEYIKGHRFLYMPEEYSMGKEYYEHLLYNNGWFDGICLHGTIAGTVRGADYQDYSGIRAVFDLDSFKYCKGPIICGHVHRAQCIGGYIYYCGDPVRFKFGEEYPKGFLICLHDTSSGRFYTHFSEIESFRYDTINIDDMLNRDPRQVISYIQGLKEQGIHKIRVQFSHDSSSIQIINDYFRNDPTIKMDMASVKKKQVEIQSNVDLFETDEYTGLEFILDETLDKKEILCQYANFLKGYTYISVDELIDLLKEE